MPSSVSILSVTKFRPGEQTFTVALVIFMRNSSLRRSYLQVIERHGLAIVGMALDLQRISGFKHDAADCNSGRSISVHRVCRKRVVRPPIPEQVSVEIQIIRRHAMPEIKVLHRDVVGSRGSIERRRRRTGALARADDALPAGS